MVDKSRRRLLVAGGAAMTGGLAGCSGVADRITGGSEEQEYDVTAVEEENEQQYIVPPVVTLSSDGVPEDGTVPIEAVFEPAALPGDSFVYFEDELTFELFVYDTYPVGNSISLTKVVEQTSVPHEVQAELLEVPFSQLPKNQQMRFRLKITNERTGDSEWVIDQRVFHYGEFGDVTIATDGRYSVIEGGDESLKDIHLEQSGERYVLDVWGGMEFAAPEIVEEVPFTREAYKVENDLYHDDNEPICVPFKGQRIEVPTDAVDVAGRLKELHDPRNYYNGFDFTAPVPPEYEYYGKNLYDVLDNPFYREMAETIHGAHSSYGVNNHFSKIDQARRTIQSNDYEAVPNLNRAPVYLPEEYWTDPATNCVGHSFQLCWLLYHMGYTCGTVWLDRDFQGVASHLGVGMPIPEAVMESDFPDGYPDTFTNPAVEPTYYIENISEIVGPDSRPERLGEHPWVYIEAAGFSRIGIVPFDPETVQEARVRFAIEPEDNVFGTDIGAPNRD